VRIAISPNAYKRLLPVFGILVPSVFGRVVAFWGFAGVLVTAAVLVVVVGVVITAAEVVSTPDTSMNKLAVATRASMSLTTYGSDATPRNPLTGVKVTAPLSGLTTYVPCAFVTVTRVHFGAISTESHNRRDAAFNFAVPGESFVAGSKVIGVSGSVEVLSFSATGAPGAAIVGIKIAVVVAIPDGPVQLFEI
jgi:hypothetical protein